MNPWMWLVYAMVASIPFLVVLALAMLIIRPEPKPAEPKPCPRCGLEPGTDPGAYRKPS